MLRIGLFGAGRIGSVHAANIAANSRARLACVYDAIPAAAEALAGTHGARAVTSAAAVLEDKSVDAVVIASPTATHVELITAAARAGKAILCEKPIDLDIAAVERCRRDIATTGAPVQIGFNRRYDRSHRAVRDAVRRGEIGALELLVISSRDVRPAPLAYLRTSGGIFRDMTIHDFDMARFVLGEDPVVEVQAAGSVLIEPALREFGDVDTAMVTLRSAAGALVHINNSRRSVYGYDQRVEAFGAGGMVRSENHRGSSLVRYDASQTAAKEPLLDFFIERYAQAYAEEIDEFIDVASGTKAPLASFDDGRYALILADAALASLQSGKTVRLDPPEALSPEVPVP
jgi:myo-inositol 2-dehydrogenase / D-chiro-inositol 1-dehydrogenase